MSEGRVFGLQQCGPATAGRQTVATQMGRPKGDSHLDVQCLQHRQHLSLLGTELPGYFSSGQGQL